MCELQLSNDLLGGYITLLQVTNMFFIRSASTMFNFKFCYTFIINVYNSCYFLSIKVAYNFISNIFLKNSIIIVLQKGV